MFKPEQIAALVAPLDKSNVKSRAQAGRQLSYIEGWKAIEEANRIFGFDMWDRETLELRQLGEPREVDSKFRVAYMCRVRITVREQVEWVPHANQAYPKITRDGCGYGSGIDRDLGQAHESAIKEAETDAMKRALMTFGNPFGLALYDKEQRNVAEAPPPAPLPREKAYVDLSKAVLKTLNTPAEIDAWLKENAKERSLVGFEKDTPGFYLLGEVVAERRAEVV